MFCCDATLQNLAPQRSETLTCQLNYIVPVHDTQRSASAEAQRRPLHAVGSALRVLIVRIFPKQRLKDLLVLFVVLKSVDIHSVVNN
jgi:hypothetical protein